MSVNLFWANTNTGSRQEDAVHVYRSTASIDPDSLPSPLVSLPAGTLNYLDTTTVDGQHYFYRVAFEKDDEMYVSEQQQILASDDAPAQWLDATSADLTNFAVLNRNAKLVLGKAPTYVMQDWYSVRKMLIALVIMRHKSDVLDTEQVVVTAEDIATTSGEWLSGFTAGDIITWRDVLKLMLIPSKSDIAATAERVIGGELLTSERRGGNYREAMGVAMTEEAILSNCSRTLCLGAAASISGEVINQQVLAQCDDFARVIRRVYDNSTIRDIMQQKSISVTVTGSNPKTIAADSMDRNQRFCDTSGNPTGVSIPRYLIGKTGDLTSTGHQTFCWQTFSGDIASASIRGNLSRPRRQMCVNQTIMEAESRMVDFRSPEIATDPHAQSVMLHVAGDGIADISPSARTIANNGAQLASSDYMRGSAIDFKNGNFLDVGGDFNLESDDFTIEAFIQGTDTYPAALSIISRWKAVDGGRSFDLALDNTSVKFYYSADGITSTIYATAAIGSNYILANGGPMHVCAQRAGSSIRLFVNGVPGDTITFNGSIFNAPNTKTIIGGRMSATEVFERPLVGKINEIMVTKGVARYDMRGFLPYYREKRFD